MAASTISRATWSNDTGTASAPNLDGTIINNTRLQNDVYAKVDEMFAGAGSYATFTLGGKLAVEGFGSHIFSAGGTGANDFRIRNTTAGTGNYAGFWIGNDASATAFALHGYSSTYTTSGPAVANGMQLASLNAGGLSIAAQDASGDIRFYAGGTTERMRVHATGGVSVIGGSGSLTPGFLAYNSANDTVQANDAVVDFDTEVYDDGTAFSGDTFTAPVAGRYLFSALVQTQAGSANQYRGINLVTSNRTYHTHSQGQVITTDDYLATLVVIADMDAADTAKVTLYLQSGTATIAGGSSPITTAFSGRLLA